MTTTIRRPDSAPCLEGLTRREAIDACESANRSRHPGSPSFIVEAEDETVSERRAAAAHARAIENRAAVCAHCGIEGVHVDTDDGEIIIEDEVAATAHHEAEWLRSGDSGLDCFDCAYEIAAAEELS